MSTVAEKLGSKKSGNRKALTLEEKKRRQRKGIIKGVVILAIAIFGSWAFYEGMKAASGTQFPVVVVVSESMEPNIHVGDLLFVHYVPPADIKNGTIADKTGDVILYNASGLWDPAITPPDPIVHRVVGKRFDVPTGKWYFVTKGDYNLDTDPPGSSGLEIEVPEDKVLGVVWGDIPYIGYVKIWLTSENIAIPLMIIIGALLVITIVWDTMHPEEEGEKKPKKGKQREVYLESPKEVVSQLGYDVIIPKTIQKPIEDQVKQSENLLEKQKPAGTELKLPSGQVPYDISNAKYALPPGDEILYSTLCVCHMVSQSIGSRTGYQWGSHVVMTSKGFAFVQPDFSKPSPKEGFKDWWNLYISSKHSTTNTYSLPAELKYLEWFNIMELKPFHKSSARMAGYPYLFYFARVNEETKEQAKQRCSKLILDFLPRIIEEKRKWLEQNQNKPEIKGLRRKFISMSMRRMIQFQGKFAAKAEKEKLKAEIAEKKAELVPQIGPNEAIPKTETSPGTEQEKPEPAKPPLEKTDINPPVKEKKDNLDFS